MLTKRIIPCLDIKNGRTVKGVNFVDLRDAGDPVELAKIYSDEGADELVFLIFRQRKNEEKPWWIWFEKWRRRLIFRLRLVVEFRQLKMLKFYCKMEQIKFLSIHRQ